MSFKRITILMFAVLLMSTSMVGCGAPESNDQAPSLGTTQSATTTMGPISASLEWQGYVSWVWNEKLGMTTTLSPYPIYTAYYQTATDSQKCPTAAGKPKQGLIGPLIFTHNTCATGSILRGNTGVKHVSLPGYLPYQTDVALWLCKLANVYGHPAVCDAAWGESARMEGWFRYHASNAYRNAANDGWHNYFGVSADIPLTMDWRDGCTTFPLGCQNATVPSAAPWSATVYTQMATLFAGGEASAKATATLMPRMVCYAAFRNAGFNDFNTQLNCNNGPGDVTHSLINYLNSVYYP